MYVTNGRLGVPGGLRPGYKPPALWGPLGWWAAGLEDAARGYLGRAESAALEAEGAGVELARRLVEVVLGVSSRLERVPVSLWRVGAVDVSGAPGARAIAYSRGEAEARWARVPGNPAVPAAWRGFPEGRVAVAAGRWLDPLEVRAAALHAAEAGASALVLEGAGWGYALGPWGYSWWAGEVLEVPVVSVPPGYSLRLSPRDTVSVVVEGEVVDSWEYNVVAVDGGPRRAAFAAPIDDEDEMIHAVAAAALARELGADVEVAFLAAPNAGALGPAAWTWAWGARWHAANMGEWIDTAIVYSLGAPTRGGLAAAGAPQLAAAAGVEWAGWECPLCQSQPLAEAGAATLTLTPRHYHDSGVVAAGARAATRPPEWGALEEALHRMLAPGPLPARTLLYELLAAARERGWESLWRPMASRHLRPVHVGDYRLDWPPRLEACLFPEACAPRLPGAGEARAITVAGEETLLYAPRGRLSVQARARLHDLLWRVRGWLRG